MNQKEMRQIALQAVRSEVRARHWSPAWLDAESALKVLDDIYRIDPQLIASLWYGNASDNQIKLFKREWNGSND